MPYSSGSESFVFEEWVALAQSDPEAFEQQRQQYIEKFIADAPDKRRCRLERLQWRIDMERRRAVTPISACVRISRMMMDAVYGEAGLVSAIKGEVGSDTTPRAKVIEISREPRLRE